MGIARGPFRPDTVGPLADTLVAADCWHVRLVLTQGEPVGGPYVRRWWLPILGPTATGLLALLAEGLTAECRSREWCQPDLACRLGVAYRGGRTSSLIRSVERLRQFRIVEADDAVIRVPSHMPVLGPRDERQLTPYVLAQYRAAMLSEASA